MYTSQPVLCMYMVENVLIFGYLGRFCDINIVTQAIAWNHHVQFELLPFVQVLIFL